MCSLIGINNMLKVVFIFQGKYGKKRGGAAGRGKSTGGFNKWKYKKHIIQNCSFVDTVIINQHSFIYQI
jgi:hypothetical protein